MKGLAGRACISRKRGREITPSPSRLVMPPVRDPGPDCTGCARNQKKLTGCRCAEDRNQHDGHEQYSWKSLNRNSLGQDSSVILHAREQYVFHIF